LSGTSCLGFLWRDDSMTPLSTLGGYNGAASSINNRGEVAGNAETATTDSTCPPYDPAQGQYQVLQDKPVVWENGQIEELPTYGGDPDGFAIAINDRGQVAGASGVCSTFNVINGLYLSPVHALLWDHGKATNLGSLGGNFGNQAHGMNNRGQVVGTSDLAGRRVAVEGVGKVGRRLVGHLAEAGAEILICDVSAAAIDRVRGGTSESTRRWFHQILNREERMAAAVVSELPGGSEAAMSMPPEAIRNLRRQQGNPAGSPSDYLFVWGYRPEVYYWSGLIPASRFISIQPVTGIPADVQYINGNGRSIITDGDTHAALDQLLKELEETKPEYIVDEAGMFNSALSITSYPGIGDFMSDYKQVEATGRLMVYRRRDPAKRQRKLGAR